MKTLEVFDVNEALPRGLGLLRDTGIRQSSRAGSVIVSPVPVTTTYIDPRRRVLFDSVRDANPFFHLFEALWILAGRKDVRTLAWFNKRMAEYSDNTKEFHAPYGFRLRKPYDQIGVACGMLRQNIDDRRTVLQIWDHKLDLGVSSKDIPCNDMVFLRCIAAEDIPGGFSHRLDITVCNRSNDVVWGAYGANAVQFSILQEYMAAKIGCAVGRYYQVSNNYHVYEDNPYWKHWVAKHPHGGGYAPDEEVPYWNSTVETTPVVSPSDVEQFDKDLHMFFGLADSHDTRESFVKTLTTHPVPMFRTEFFRNVVTPMLYIHDVYNDKAVDWNTTPIPGSWRRCDWLYAGIAWVNRREAKKQAGTAA